MVSNFKDVNNSIKAVTLQQECAKEVCSVVVEILVILCSSVQNCFMAIKNNGVGVLVVFMKMETLQFSFELQCNCWKLLTMMMKAILDKGCDQVCKY